MSNATGYILLNSYTGDGDEDTFKCGKCKEKFNKMNLFYKHAQTCKKRKQKKRVSCH